LIKDVLDTSTGVLKIIFSPYFKSKDAATFVTPQSNNSLLTNIIPQQTWQFNRGENVYDSKNSISNLSVLVSYKKDTNRTDKITKLSDFSQVENRNKFGGQ